MSALALGARKRASDLTFEPQPEQVAVRYRIDGVCVERENAPRRMLSAIIARIKILSKIDISEKRRPTDGRIKITVGDKQLDLRVSIIPTNHGQSVVMRLLDKDSIKRFQQGIQRSFNFLKETLHGRVHLKAVSGREPKLFAKHLVLFHHQTAQRIWRNQVKCITIRVIHLLNRNPIANRLPARRPYD